MNARKTIADKEASNAAAKRTPEKKSGLLGFKPWPKHPPTMKQQLACL